MAPTLLTYLRGWRRQGQRHKKICLISKTEVNLSSKTYESALQWLPLKALCAAFQNVQHLSSGSIGKDTETALTASLRPRLTQDGHLWFYLGSLWTEQQKLRLWNHCAYDNKQLLYLCKHNKLLENICKHLSQLTTFVLSQDNKPEKTLVISSKTELVTVTNY